MSFHVKHTYLSHLKKCSNQNSVQLKHVVQFASKTVTSEPKPIPVAKKKTGIHIKNRIIKMEIPKTEDDEQQQLVKFVYRYLNSYSTLFLLKAIALSASIKTASEPPNAFDILQAAAKKMKTIE
jgi:hypothetical protein